MNRKNLVIVILIALAAGAAAGGVVTYLMNDDDGTGTVTGTTATVETKTRGDTDEVACTADARQCPDGSYVGRTAPDCEFAECPPLPPVQQAENIKVNVPVQGALITSPVVISGEARVFEGTVNYRLLDGNDNVIAEGFMTAASPEVGQFGPYTVNVEFTAPETAYGKIEVFDYSARDGSKENLVTVLVQFR